MFGDKYYELCIGHSRDYASKYKIKLSKLCYADKYCGILTPIWLLCILSEFDKPTVLIIREKYVKWWNENGNNRNYGRLLK